MTAATLTRPTRRGAHPDVPAPAHARVARLPWLLGAAGLSLAYTTFPFRDPDVWWHLAIGDVIRTSGIPSSEPFTFAGAPNPWIGQQWLYEVSLSRMVSAGGPGLAMVVMGVIGAGAFLMAALSTRRRDRVGGPALAASMVACGLVAASVLGVRGQVVTVAFSAATLVIVARWREGSRRVVWVLPPMLLVWANLHAGFVTGLALCATAVVTVAAHRALQGVAAEPTARVRDLLAATAVAAAATLVNPAGPHLIGYVAATFTNPTLTSGIDEWMSPDFHSVWMRLLEVLVVGLVALWAVSRRPDPLDVVLALGTFAATLQAQRNVALLALVLTPQLAHYGTLAWRQWRGEASRRRPAPTALVGVGALAIALATVAGVVLPAASSSSTSRWEREHEPAAATTWLSTHRLGAHLYSTYEWGGYLVDRLPRRHMVWIYGESEVFGDQRLRDYLTVHNLAAGWQEMLRRNGIHDAVLPQSSRETVALLEVGWTPLCRDGAAAAVVLEEGSRPARGTAPADPAAAPACQ